MRKLLHSLLLSAFALVVLGVIPGTAQQRNGTITGHVTDATKAVLKGAQVELQPSGQTAVTDDQGQYIISGVAPGRYKLMISAVGFAQYANNDVGVTSGGLVNVDATLQVEAHMEVIEVRAEREHGEV